MSQLTDFMLTHPWMRVVRVLLISTKPRSVRELIDISGLSPGGVQDVLRRLREKDVIRTTRQGNKLLCSLHLEQSEHDALSQLFSKHDEDQLRSRAELFSKRREEAVGWIDETIRALRRARDCHTLKDVQN